MLRGTSPSRRPAPTRCSTTRSRSSSARLLEHGDRLAPAYTTTGDPVPDQRHLGLPGYPGGFDIIGNWVNQQFQLDAYGEALQLLAAAGRARPARHRTLARGRNRRHGDRAALDRARRRNLGDRPPRLDAQQAHRRRRAARHRGRAPDARTRRRVDRAGRPDRRRHLGPRPAPRRALATLPRRPRARRRLAAAGAARSDPVRRPTHHCHPAGLPAGPDRRRVRLPLPSRRAPARPTPRGRSCCADSSPLSPCTSRDEALQARGWFERTRAASGPAHCSARSTTRPNTRCAATCRRRSCTR